MDTQGHSLLRSFAQRFGYDQTKIILLSICFFVMFSGYTITKELKDFIFLKTVGCEHVAEVKIYAIFFLIPFIFIYSRFVDILHRHQLLYLYSLLYGIGGLIAAYFVGHPTIGLANTEVAYGRLFGWVFYLFMEGYTPFVISVLWAFTNSVTKPKDVKSGYISFTIASKSGGALVSGLTWLACSMIGVGSLNLSAPALVQWLLIIASMLLLFAPIIISFLIRAVPHAHLHGYEAAYVYEVKHDRKEAKEKGGIWKAIKGMLSGLYVFLRFPYMLGIFGMIFFWEVVNVTFNIIRLKVGESCTGSPVELMGYLYQQTFFMHLAGLAIVSIGTATLVRLLGERRSLIAIPVLTGVALGYYFIFQTLQAATVSYVFMRAINYAFAYPLRESLYIPTTREIKFKAKSWIDGFGTKISKGAGGSYSWLVTTCASSAFGVHVVFFAGVIALWSFVAHLLGKRFEDAVAANEVIGAEE